LALHWHIFHPQPLQEYAQDTVQLLDSNHHLLPPKSQYFFKHMKKNNWLVMYKEVEGIKSVLYGMTYRINNKAPLHEAMIDLENKYSIFENKFMDFFPLLINHCQEFKNAK
jgi:acyl carrier protein phosphodiesterase